MKPDSWKEVFYERVDTGGDSGLHGHKKNQEVQPGLSNKKFVIVRVVRGFSSQVKLFRY
jgi:hypothetical protein